MSAYISSTNSDNIGVLYLIGTNTAPPLGLNFTGYKSVAEYPKS